RGPFHAEMRLDRATVNMARAYLFGTGPGTVLPSRLHAFLKTERGLPVPDIQFLFRGAPARAHPWFPGVTPAYEDSFGLRPVMLQPESRGTVRLRSADPTAPVRIAQNFLASDRDVRTIREGVRLARDLASRTALDSVRGRETSPGPTARSAAEIDAFVRRTALTAHHPCATCAMGGGEGAVLDPELPRGRGRRAARRRRLRHARPGLREHQRLRADDRGEGRRPRAGPTTSSPAHGRICQPSRHERNALAMSSDRQDATPVRVKKVGHVVFTVSDIERTRRSGRTSWASRSPTRTRSDQIGSDGRSRPAEEWRRAKTLEEAVANSLVGVIYR